MTSRPGSQPGHESEELISVKDISKAPAPPAKTTAHQVVTALALPPPRRSPPVPASPLRLTGLGRLPRDASMLYDIGRVDDSGRIASSDIVRAMQWQPGGRLEAILTPRAIVLRAASDGLLIVPHRPCIVIPSHVRRPHGIKAGDNVLIAAAPGFALVTVYPLSALDEMISHYHSNPQGSNERSESE